MTLDPTRRRALQWLAAGAALPALPTRAADTYPSHPVHLTVGTPAGSTFDTIARAASVEAEKRLGQPIVVENRSGAGGTTSFLHVKALPPDGYNLVVLSLSTIRQPLIEDIPYDPIKDFTWIASLAEIGFAVTVAADSPFKTWPELLAFGRAHPDQVSYGAPSGLGNSAHLFVSEVAVREHVDWTPVPFRGSSDTMTALMGHQLTFSVDTLISGAPLERAGKIRFLAMATDARQKPWPEVPTMKEFGYNLSIDSPMGIGGPAAMSPAVVQKIQDAYKFATEQPAYVDFLARSAQHPRYMDSADFTAFAQRAMTEQRSLLVKYGLARKNA